MNKKISLLVGLSLFFLISMPGYMLAEEDELGDESWTVEERLGRWFYFTHGTVIWGHEFGFFKDKNDCGTDILWLTFSSYEENVKDFIGKDVVILLNVDGKDFRIKTPMLNTYKIASTNVMSFTNWIPDDELMSALMKGRYAKVRILEPKELEELMDIKEDTFGLDGFVATREKAELSCRSN